MENEENVVVEEKVEQPAPAKVQKKFSFKFLSLVLTLSAVFFMLLGGFIMICGGSVGILAMTGIATLLNIFSLASLVVQFVLDKQIKFEAVHIVIALSLLVNILALF